MKINYFSELKRMQNFISNQVCCNDYRILRLFILNTKFLKTPFSIFKERVKTLIRVLKMPLYIKFKKVNADYMVLATSKFANRSVISKYIGNYDHTKNLFFISNSITEPIYIASYRDFFRFLKIYLNILKDILLLCVIFNKIPTKELSYFLYHKVKLLLYKPKKLYIYSTQDLNANLAAFFSSHCMQEMQLDILIGFMEMDQRYGCYKNSKICFISKVVKVQYETFMKIGWIKAENITLSVTGNTGFFMPSEKSSFAFDVGFYSSGIWARNGIYRVYDIDEITKNKNQYCKNIYAKIEMITLYGLVKLAEKYGFKLRIYLHPYEKELICKFGIYPPYWDKANGSTVTIDHDLDGKNDFFETKIGVVVNSTIFYDRWDHDLVTLCYYPKCNNKLVLIPLKYLGKYSKYGFKNIKELEQKIVNELHEKDESQ